ncbi:DNA-binding protein [Rhodobacterales bacterium HKCCE3408]|nr:DNA-binding protein [Rhodobacterales bacterium HKCCE3408]
MPRLLTPREAAEALGKSEKWLEADRHAGPSIPFVRIGRSVRYRAEVIRDVVLRHEVEAVTPT